MTTYSASGLSPTTTYYYQVLAYNSAGNSANSNTASATTPILTVPAPPSNLTAIAVSSTQVNLAWTDNSGNETGFKIDRATSSDFSQNLVTVTTTANVTSYVDTVGDNTTYYYRVRATNSSGDSASTNTAIATTPATTSTIGVWNNSFETPTGLGDGSSGNDDSGAEEGPPSNWSPTITNCAFRRSVSGCLQPLQHSDRRNQLYLFVEWSGQRARHPGLR